MDYTNVVLVGLNHVDGAENPGGVAEQAYIIPLSYLDEVQEPTPGTTPESI